MNEKSQESQESTWVTLRRRRGLGSRPRRAAAPGISGAYIYSSDPYLDLRSRHEQSVSLIAQDWAIRSAEPLTYIEIADIRDVVDRDVRASGARAALQKQLELFFTGSTLSKRTDLVIERLERLERRLGEHHEASAKERTLKRHDEGSAKEETLLKHHEATIKRLEAERKKLHGAITNLQEYYAPYVGGARWTGYARAFMAFFALSLGAEIVLGLTVVTRPWSLVGLALSLFHSGWWQTPWPRHRPRGHREDWS